MDQPDLFLEGWRSLPDELKLHVLSFALPSGIPIHAMLFNKNPMIISVGQRLPNAVGYFARLYKTVTPYLAIPEIAHLATEVFYKQNITMMRYDFNYLPPLSTRHHVRRIEFHFGLSYEVFGNLRRFFHGEFDFVNLELVELKIEASNSIDSREIAIFKSSYMMISVRTKELCISFMHYDAFHVEDFLGDGSSHGDQIAAAVLPLFTIFTQKDVEIQEQWYIRNDGDLSERKHHVFTETYPYTRNDQRVIESVLRA